MAGGGDVLVQAEQVAAGCFLGAALQPNGGIALRPGAGAARRTVRVEVTPHGVEQVVAGAPRHPFQVGQLPEVRQRRRVHGLRPVVAPGGAEPVPVHLVVVDGDAVGALPLQGMHQRAVVVEAQRRPGAVAMRAVGEHAGIEAAGGAGGEGAELLVGGVEVRVHGVHRRHVVHQSGGDPGRHVQPDVMALGDGLWHPHAELQPPAPLGAALIEQRPRAFDEAGHERLPRAGDAAVAARRGKVEALAERQLQAVHVEAVDHLLHDPVHVVAHPVEGEVHPVAGHEGGAVRQLGELPLRMRVQEHAALVGRAVAVVHPESGHEAHPALPCALQQHLQRHDPLVHQGNEAPVLRAGVVLEPLGAEEHGPGRVVDLLDQRVRAAQRDVVHHPAQLLDGGGLGGDQRSRVSRVEVVVGHARWIADVDQPPIGSVSAPCHGIHCDRIGAVHRPCQTSGTVRPPRADS